MFSNRDFSVDTASICTKFLGYVPHSPPEGSMSRNFDLGPGFLFHVKILKNNFFSIIYDFCHKNETNIKMRQT